MVWGDKPHTAPFIFRKDLIFMSICAEVANRIAMECTSFRFDMISRGSEEIYNNAFEIVVKNDIDYFFGSLADLPEDKLYLSEDVLKTLLNYKGNLLDILCGIYIERDCQFYEDIISVIKTFAESIENKE